MNPENPKKPKKFLNVCTVHDWYSETESCKKCAEEMSREVCEHGRLIENNGKCNCNECYPPNLCDSCTRYDVDCPLDSTCYVTKCVEYRKMPNPENPNDQLKYINSLLVKIESLQSQNSTLLSLVREAAKALKLVNNDGEWDYMFDDTQASVSETLSLIEKSGVLR